MYVQPGQSPVAPGVDPSREVPDEGTVDQGPDTGVTHPMLSGIDDAWFGGPSDVLGRTGPD